MNWLCRDCHLVAVLPRDATPTKCGTCGSTNGYALSDQHLDEGSKAGVYFNIDPRTGKRAKKKRR